MYWWGPSWFAPVNETLEEGPPPYGGECGGCGAEIVWGDQGVAVPKLYQAPVTLYVHYHRDCFLEVILGPRAKDIIDGA